MTEWGYYHPHQKTTAKRYEVQGVLHCSKTSIAQEARHARNGRGGKRASLTPLINIEAKQLCKISIQKMKSFWSREVLVEYSHSMDNNKVSCGGAVRGWGKIR